MGEKKLTQDNHQVWTDLPCIVKYNYWIFTTRNISAVFLYQRIFSIFIFIYFYLRLLISLITETRISGPGCSKVVQSIVVQSIVRLTSSLRGQLIKCFILYYQLPHILIFFVEKCFQLLQCKSFSHFFNKKYWHI